MPITFVINTTLMYYLVYGIIYLFSMLPMWILYGIGDFVNLVLFRIFGYRRKIVYKNLAIAFPEKSIAERKAITRKFEQNFTDTFIETLKMFSASREFIMKRVKGDFDILQGELDKGAKCQAHMGHNFNWEIGQYAIPYYIDITFLVVYMPLKNKTMDRIFLRLRGRSGTILLPATDMRSQMMAFRNKQYILGLAADQVPGKMKNAYWLNFFGMPTAFVPGPEKGAIAGDITVLFIHITKEKRGHYYIHCEVASEHPANLPKGELTRRYRDFLEKVTRERPDMWLWSHRRWKKTWDPALSSQWVDLSPPPAAIIKPYELVED